MSKNISRLTFLLISIWFFWELSDYFPNNVLAWDVYGAYLHLPANFIYKDPFLTDWSWIERLNEQYNSTPSYYQFWYADTGNQVIKYPLGFALIYAPFFFLAHWLAPVFGYAQDGFSAPYQWFIIAGHCFYVLIGLWMARKVMLHFFSEKITALLLVILFAGTNFFFTTTTMVAMPHGHLFLFYALILWYTIQWHKTPNTKYSILLGLSIGLAALIRATEILVVLIPLLWNVNDKASWNQKWQLIKMQKKYIFILIIAVALIGSIQLIYYKLATGKYFIDAYNNAGEGFDFLSPHTLEFLFSARKGWLVYTPIFIFSFWGFWFMWKQKHFGFLPLFLFSVFNIYLLSSWTCWWYAESFGQRALVQSYLVLLIPLGFLLEFLLQQKWLMKVSIFSVMGLFVALNLFQTWQLHHGLIHPSRMTPDAYWAHFLKTNAVFNFADLLLVNKDVPAAERLENEMDKLMMAKQFRFVFDSENWKEIGANVKHKLTGALVDEENIYSKGVFIDYIDATAERAVIFKFQASIYFEDDLHEIMPMLVFKIMHEDETFFERYFNVLEVDILTPFSWNDVEFSMYSPDIRSFNKSRIQIFSWLTGKGSFRVDDMRLTIYEGLK